MQLILLSGGSGKRLWPLSNDVRSKQFLKIFKNNDGILESMVQRVYRGLKASMPDCEITVATAKKQVSSLTNQLSADVNICVEPDRRDTFPAIVLAASYLKDVKGVSPDEPIVVCPVDPYVGEDYFKTVRKIGEAVDTANLILMGISPTYPSEKYGYILTDGNGNVTGFKEKPDLETAKKLLSEHALWNGGVFGFKLSYILEKGHEYLDFTDYDDLHSKYAGLKKISFDYAVAEKETSIKAVKFDGEWIDVGTWKTLTDVTGEVSLGDVTFDNNCNNTTVINETDVPILALGLKNIIVAASADGILVSDKNASSYMKPYVETMEAPLRFAEKSWGSYRVLDIEPSGLTVKVTLNPGSSMNYHSHMRRDEVWTVLEGTGETVIDGNVKKVSAGDTIFIPKGTKHLLRADTRLVAMEVQIGADIDVSDKLKHEL